MEILTHNKSAGMDKAISIQAADSKCRSGEEDLHKGTMSGLVTFEEIGHTYAVDGVPVELCVSEVLELAGISGYSDRVPRHLIEHAGAIGTAVHKACHYLDLGELDVDTVDEQIAGYVMGYHKFMQTYEPRWTLIEEPMAYSVLGLAGTADRIGSIWQFTKQPSQREEEPVILDIKTAVKVEKYWDLQLSAYAILAGREDCSLYVLHLRKSGDYELLPCKFEPEVFHAALKVAQWKSRNGLSKRT